MRKRLVVLLALVVLLTSLLLGYGYFLAPRHLSVKTKVLESEKINPSLNGISIVYFSDVYFNEFVDQKRFDAIVKKINSLAPDVILFGGNLVADQFESDEDRTNLLQSLKSLEAPYGKFAVMGDLEQASTSYLTNIDSFLQEANIELLSNQLRVLYFGNEHSINLIGLESITSDFNTPNDFYTIAFSHSPSLNKNVQADLIIAGQTLGGQINLPYLRDTFIHNNDPYRGSHGNLDISNGVGTTQFDMRLFAPAQINQYILKGKWVTFLFLSLIN